MIAAASLAQSAALAATAPPDTEAAAMVRRAARLGADATERGMVVPLPLLLDLEALVCGRSVGRPSLRPVHPPTRETAAYDRWLQDFVALAARYLGIPDRRQAGGHRVDWDLTPLLAPYFPSGAPQPGFSAAFRGLCADVGVGAVLSAWAGTRTSSGWHTCFPGDLAEPRSDGWGEGTWALISAATGSEWLDERCDHEAARMYLEAANPTPTIDQQRRIWRLLRRRPLQEPNPLTQSFENQAPYHGAITPATLAAGRHGEFKIVNRSDDRLTNPPPVRPPQSVDIHLCWAHGYAALDRSVPALAFRDSTSGLGGARAGEVSVLQAFAALLFDDWRSALDRVNVRFHAHGGAPRTEGDDFGRPGKRWKLSRPSGPMPPARVIARFFQRATWLSVDAAGLAWRGDRSVSSWWCLIVLGSELGDLGIEPIARPALRDTGFLVASTDALPSCISTVIVLDPADRNGTIYATLPSPDAGRIHLRPIPVRHATNNRNASFESLRLRGLDALLDALEVRT